MYILPRIWKLTQCFQKTAELTFSMLREAFNARTLSKYLEIATNEELIRKENKKYHLTEKGRIYNNLIIQVEELLAFSSILNQIPRREIHNFLLHHVSALKQHFGENLLGVLLYGSSTSSKWQLESDIDLLLVVKEWNSPTWERSTELYRIRKRTLNEMREVFDIPVSYYPLTLTELDRDHAIFPDIQRTGIILWDHKNFMKKLLDKIKQDLVKQNKFFIQSPEGEELWIQKKM